ncbi:MAG TPA: hypothetical protein VG326_21010 [Tepidisphaeraceae bacterium]|jgi:hypothetical protein|nr:hypothetical protein [Tepidisphaeraceae bacterium]
MHAIEIKLSEKNSERATMLARSSGKTPDELVNEVFERFASPKQLTGADVADRRPAESRGHLFGMFKGKIWVSDDFDAPLSDEELKEWGL